MSSEISRNEGTGALSIALQWAELPPEHLAVALQALEPQLRREHELNKLRLEVQDNRERRAHTLYMTGLIAGFLLALGMLGGAIVVGVQGSPWLAAMLSGPSMLALVTLFVLRRSDPGALRHVARTHDKAVASASPPL